MLTTSCPWATGLSLLLPTRTRLGYPCIRSRFIKSGQSQWSPGSSLTTSAPIFLSFFCGGGARPKWEIVSDQKQMLMLIFRQKCTKTLERTTFLSIFKNYSSFNPQKLESENKQLRARLNEQDHILHNTKRMETETVSFFDQTFRQPDGVNGAWATPYLEKCTC